MQHRIALVCPTSRLLSVHFSLGTPPHVHPLPHLDPRTEPPDLLPDYDLWRLWQAVGTEHRRTEGDIPVPQQGSMARLPKPAANPSWEIVNKINELKIGQSTTAKSLFLLCNFCIHFFPSPRLDKLEELSLCFC